jgi:hypothetical protein
MSGRGGSGYAVGTMCTRYTGWYFFFGSGVSPGVPAGRV